MIDIIGAFFGRIPWQVYIAAAFVTLLPLSYCKGRHDGKELILERLAGAEVKAKKKATEAAAKADGKLEAAAEAFEATQDTIRKELEDAQSADRNSLDALFERLP